MLSDWEIKARAHRCARTGEPFQDGAAIYTLLFREGHRFLREDVSEGAWQQLKGTLRPFSFWKSRYESLPAKSPEVVPRESAEALLRHLLEEGDPRSTNARYVLALMLERKRTLRPVDQRETADGRILVYEHVKTGEVFVISDPRLNLADIEPVQHEVYQLLAGRAPAVPPAEPENARATEPGEPGA
ncbi:MAG: hypothetical protein JO069_01660 [Verrucomicrobia bacterium]|nr:hypothetical protein [Verrucomicrobiota bacterium]